VARKFSADAGRLVAVSRIQNVRKMNMAVFRTLGLLALMVLITVFTVVCRRPYYINAFNLSPDEAELVAISKLAGESWFPYSNYTTPTSGPIWPEFLSALSKMGVDLTFPNLHILSVALVGLAFIPLQWLILHSAKRDLALVSLPIFFITVAVYLPTHSNFAELATETLPLAILTVTVMINARKVTPKRSFLAGFLCAFAIFGKYQVLPLILSVSAYLWTSSACGELSKKERREIQWKFWIGISTSSTAILCLIALGGGMRKFLVESVGFSLDYTNGGQSLFNSGGNVLEKFINGYNLIESQTLVFLALTTTVLIILYRIVFRKFSLNYHEDSRKGILSILTIFLGMTSVSSPGNFFPHYLLLLMWSILVSLVILVKNDSGTCRKTQYGKWGLNKKNSAIILLSLCLAFSLFAINRDRDIILLEYQQARSEKYSPRLTYENQKALIEPYSHLCPNHSRVLIWGWAAELYTYYDWYPTRDFVNDSIKYLSGFEKQNIQQRLKDNIGDKATMCVIEAIGDNFFYNINSMYSLENVFPEILPSLEKEYFKVESREDGFVLWIRKKGVQAR
jgi:hypothetical protein